jgi:hypothetical protein
VSNAPVLGVHINPVSITPVPCIQLLQAERGNGLVPRANQVFWRNICPDENRLSNPPVAASVALGMHRWQPLCVGKLYRVADASTRMMLQN